MLRLKAACEKCGQPLPPDSVDALICSFECTFCVKCVEGPLEHSCPNCGGDLQPRPTRSQRYLHQYPAALE